MSTPKYAIGDKLFWATFNQHEPVYVECPDCGGTGRLRVIFHDETVVSIDCQNCSLGYDPPTGRVLIYQNKPDVTEVSISGMEIRKGEPTEYKAYIDGGPNYCPKVEDLFETWELAKKRAEELHEKYVEEQKERVYKKEKNARTWAWNASYHRNLIKRAKKDIEYHTSKLDAANLKQRKSSNE